jgi:hypothetical protein
LLQPALLGGLFIGVLSALPFVSLCNCCCLWIVGGGALAAYLEQQNDRQPISVGRGARVGLFAGVAGAFVWLLASQMLDVVMAPVQDWMVGEVLRNAQDMPPDARAWLESLVASRSSAGRYAFGFALMLVGGSLFAAVGGVIGAGYFRRDVPPALGGPAAPPPLP